MLSRTQHSAVAILFLSGDNDPLAAGSPVNPGMQVQTYPAPTSSHVPLF